MDPNKKFLPSEINVIQLVKKHPIIYTKDLAMTEDQYKTTLYKAWEEISKNLGLPSKICEQQWKTIISNYAVLKNLIYTGKVSEEIIQRHHETNKFLDGTLSFMDPYLSEITDTDVSSSVDKSLNNIFGVELPNNVQNEFIDSDTVVTHEQVPTYNLTHDMSESNSYRDTELTSERIKLELESELIIEDNIKMELGVEDDVMEDNFTQDHDRNIPVEAILPDNQVRMSVVDNVLGRNVDSVVIDNTRESIPRIDSNDVTSITDNAMRKFFNELGEVLDAELSPEKQNILQAQINALLKKEFHKE